MNSKCLSVQRGSLSFVSVILLVSFQRVLEIAFSSSSFFSHCKLLKNFLKIILFPLVFVLSTLSSKCSLGASNGQFCLSVCYCP